MSEADPRSLETIARAYLAEQLQQRAPAALSYEGHFDERPLETEGAATVFSFELAAGARDAVVCGNEDRRHYVVVGETEPNYFPAYGLDVDGAYSLHIGTRFMLEMGIQRAEIDREPPQARARLRAIAAEHAPSAEIDIENLAALFTCEGDYYAVYRVRIDSEPAYFMGADCPPGVYRMTDYPPQAALRLHLGQLIRAEARAEKNVP